MGVTELIEAAQFVVDAEGNKKAVQLDWVTWERLLQSLESLQSEVDNLAEELEEFEEARLVLEIEGRIASGEEQVRDWIEIER